MAPKAKMRPAAALGRVRGLRRPAAAPSGVRRGEPVVPEKKLCDESVQALMKLGCLHLKEAKYFLRAVEIAGNIKKIQTDSAGQLILDFQVSGTRDDGLLRELSGRPDRMCQVHVCDPGCPATTTGDVYLHGSKYKEVKKEDEGWMTNLESVPGGGEADDEMEALRRAAQEAEGRRKEESPKKEKEKKKKKEKKRKKEDDSEEKESPKPKSVEMERGQKKLKAVFGGTSLDPDPEVKAKQMKKARRLGKSKKKKKKKSGSSKGTSSGSSEEESSTDEGEGLFENEKKIKTIWRKYPGSLACAGLMEARENLISSAGTLWSVDQGSLPPIFTQYGRVQLLPHMAPAMGQETLTLCVALDLLVQGKVASCTDLLAQRVKSLESTSRGTHWQISRQLELVRSELQGLTEEQEAYMAARRAREEQKIRSMSSKAPGAGGYDRGPGRDGQTKGKTKDAKGGNKGRADDPGKGRDAGKRDGKQEWQKKDGR